MENLELQLENAFKKITPETCLKIIKQIRTVEDKFWEDDAKLDKMEEECGQI